MRAASLTGFFSGDAAARLAAAFLEIVTIYHSFRSAIATAKPGRAPASIIRSALDDRPATESLSGQVYEVGASAVRMLWGILGGHGSYSFHANPRDAREALPGYMFLEDFIIAHPSYLDKRGGEYGW
jgi:hypothetical protein